MKEVKLYHENGKPKELSYLDEKNRKTGQCLKWYESGQMLENTQWLAGKRHGLCYWWHPNGILMERSCWENGGGHGEVLWLSDDGTVCRHAFYDHNKDVSQLVVNNVRNQYNITPEEKLLLKLKYNICLDDDTFERTPAENNYSETLEWLERIKKYES
jgi:hypothetical protein